MSVLPYAYETLEAVTAQEVAGDYLYVNHGKDISSQMKPAVSIELNLDGSITGEATGTWRLVGDYFTWKSMGCCTKVYSSANGILP